MAWRKQKWGHLFYIKPESKVGSILFDVRLGKDGQVSEANKSSIPVKTDKLNHFSADAIV